MSTNNATTANTIKNATPPTSSTTTNAKANNNANSNATSNDSSKQQRLKYIANVVRALVTSRKPPCKLREIIREYNEIEGEQLPARKLGYATPKDLLKATGEFTFSAYGDETYINAIPSSKSAHISSMVRQQKTSKSTRITPVPQVRQPKRSDQSWNKSSYSSNVYQRLPPVNNRWKSSNNTGSNNSTGDRNNNSQYNRNSSQQQRPSAQQPQRQLPPQQQQQKVEQKQPLRQPHKQQQQPQQQSRQAQAVTEKPQQRQPQTPPKTRQQSTQPSQSAKAAQDKSTNEPTKDLREMLNAKQQLNGADSSKAAASDLRERLNAKKQQSQNHQQQQQSQPLQRYVPPAQQQVNEMQQQQQQQQQQMSSPRPILGQNSSAVAIASGMILAKYEQQLHGQQRAELVAMQRQQQQQQQQHQKMLQQQQQQQMHQQQKLMQAFQQQPQQQQPPQQHSHPRSIMGPGKKSPPSIAPNAAPAVNPAAVAAGGGAASSVQDRLKIKVNNTNGHANGGNSVGNTPETSPAISSAGSENVPNPFGPGAGMPLVLQQPQFHKHFIKPQYQDPMPIIPPRVFQFNTKLDPITSLSQYCLVRRYGSPSYSTIRSKFSRLYQCRVNVNGTIFSTYPNEYLNEHLAKISCAQKAIEQLKLQEARRPLPPCTDSDHELIDKFYTELLKHPAGIFAKNIPEWFENAFQQALPEHWWTLVQTSNRFTTENATNNAVIIFANTEAEKPDGMGGTIMQMDAIIMPWKQKYWQLYITHCASTVDVWARLFGKDYSERFDAVMNEIDLHMVTAKTRPLSLTCKSVYLVCINECWHRVRVEELDKVNATARCFFIDYGDSDWLAVSELYICEQQFLRLPAQAVLFSLFGLEDFAGNPNARRHLDAMLSNKSVVAEILTKQTDFYDTESSACGKIQVVLYDTSTQEDVNLNPLLLNQICDDTPPPEIKHKGATNVLVSHVSDEGDLYLQIMNTDFKYVQKLIQQLIESKFKREQHKITYNDLKRSNLFLICDDANESEPSWYRGALTESPFKPEDEEFDIFYVDHGITQRTHISKMFRLESLSAALSKFPRQAIKARLHNIPPISKSIVGRMRALMPANCAAFVKMNKPGKVPFVTVYRRHESSDMLCNINEDIRMEHELECSSAALSADEDNTSNGADVQKNGSSGVTSPTPFVEIARGLKVTSVPNSPQKAAELPKLKNYHDVPQRPDEYFEVRVTMSANPSNFTIQPYKDYPHLRDLMKELQGYCENNDEFIPADMVEIGQAYAAKNPDGFYHRVTVVNTYNGEMIHVFFCDFGDIAILRSDQLKILPAKYRQLPKMAMQAKLHGIVAKNGDWSLEDCLRFRQLTVGQKFMAAIKKISYDKLSTPDTPILELELIDVTTDDDIFIHEVLLKEERAVKEDESN